MVKVVGDRGDDVIFFDIVGVTGLACDAFFCVFGAAQPPGFAVGEGAGHCVAAAPAEGDAGEGGAIGFLIGMAGAAGAFLEDECVGVAIPEGGEVGGRGRGGDVVIVEVAGVVVAVE